MYRGKKNVFFFLKEETKTLFYAKLCVQSAFDTIMGRMGEFMTSVVYAEVEAIFWLKNKKSTTCLHSFISYLFKENAYDWTWSGLAIFL